jgi:hypothetical protein
VDGRMSATLQREARGATANRTTPNTISIKPFMTGLGEGFETAFAVCVLLGALWLLVSGYA